MDLSLLQLQIVGLLNPDNPFLLDPIFLLISLFGNWKFLGVLSLLVSLKDRGLGKVMLLTLLVTATLVFPLKLAINDGRPWAEHGEIRGVGGEEPSGSFPSGHAAFAFAYFVVLSKRKHTRSLFTLAILVAFSRLYLGQHYPLDILGGALIGSFSGYLIGRFFILE